MWAAGGQLPGYSWGYSCVVMMTSTASMDIRAYFFDSLDSISFDVGQSVDCRTPHEVVSHEASPPARASLLEAKTVFGDTKAGEETLAAPEFLSLWHTHCPRKASI